jgi:ATP-dependent Clp protease ATP-binding subunit ClpA
MIQKTRHKIAEPDFQKAMQDFTTDLVHDGRNHPPIIGRDSEIDAVIATINSNTTHCALIIGDPGVGKTSIFYAYADRLRTNKVPGKQNNIQLLKLNLPSMARDLGKYQENFDIIFQGIAERNRNGETNIVIAIPNIDTIIGVGTYNGQPIGAQHHLKSVIDLGDIKFLVDCSTDKFREHFGSDAAFLDGAKIIKLNSLNKADTLAVLSATTQKTYKHYGVTSSAEQQERIYELTRQYLPHMPQPKTSIAILNESANKANLDGMQTIPPEIILETVENWANLQPGFLQKERTQIILDLETTLKRDVIGQDHAITPLVTMASIAQARLHKKDKPRSICLFLGPTGTGKTLMAYKYTEATRGSDEHLLRLDMAEYMDDNSSSKLLGTPPGFIGYKLPGVLVEAVQNNPNIVILVDEIKKAHPDVMNLFLGIMDNGYIRDGKGNQIDCRNIELIMTSNIGAKEAAIASQKGNFGFENGNQISAKDIMLKALAERYAPEFENRFDEIVVFNNLKPEHMPLILDREIADFNKTLLTEHGFTVHLAPKAREQLITAGYSHENGARPLKRAIANLLIGPLSVALMRGMNPQKGAEYIIEGVGDDYAISLKQPENLIIRSVHASVKPANNNRSPRISKHGNQ